MALRDAVESVGRLVFWRIAIKPEAHEAYNRALQARLATTSWAAGCGSWYKTDDGVMPNNWAGNTAEFARGKAPTDVGHAFAAVWQGVLDHVEERNGHRLPIDVSVAATPSPSAALTD